MILTVGTDDGLREQVAASLRDTEWATTVGNVTSVGEAEEVLRSATPPRAVVVGRSIGVDGAADVASTAASLRTPPVVLLVGTPTTTLLRQAMRAGVRDVLPVDFGPADLVNTLREAGVTSGGPEPLPGLTVAVFSTKGGVGCSVVASNLAVLLARRTGQPTTLVDLDLASADQAIMHGVAPRWTIQDLAAGSVALDGESLQQVLVDVPGSESRLLPGPVDPALAETITASDVGAIVAAVRAESPIAVLDTASAFDDRTLTALDAADVTVLVSSLDVAALRSLSVSLQTMERLGIDPKRVLIALVRVDSKSGLVVADVERAVDRTIDVGVPSTRAVPRSVNEGIPLAVSTPKAGVVTALEDLVELLVVRLPEDLRTPPEEAAASGSAGSGLFRWSRSRGDDDTPTPASRPSAPPGAPPAPASAPANPTPTPPPPAEAQSADGSNVRPIRVRQAEGRRRVRRRDTEESPDDGGDTRPAPTDAAREAPMFGDRDVEAGPPATDETEAPDAVEEAEPAIRAVPPLEALPPPTVADTDEDDQPRRRRRR